MFERGNNLKILWFLDYWTLPSSLFIGVFVLLIQMAAFSCRVLLFDSLSMTFPPSRSMMWLSVVAWSMRADLLKIDINLVSTPCVILIVCVVYVLPVFIQSCFLLSPGVSNILVIITEDVNEKRSDESLYW